MVNVIAPVPYKAENAIINLHMNDAHEIPLIWKQVTGSTLADPSWVTLGELCKCIQRLLQLAGI